MQRIRAYITLYGPVSKDSPGTESRREIEFDYDSGIPGMPLEGAQGHALSVALKWISQKGGALYYGAVVTRMLHEIYPR
jgi:hypothetical protein